MPCLYALRHHSGHYWVELSHDGMPLFVLPPLKPSDEAMLGNDPGDWRMHLIRELPRLPLPRLRAVHAAFVDKLRARDPWLLNPPPAPRSKPKPTKPPKQPPSTAKLVILDNGSSLSHREAAARLGCLPTTLAKRLRLRRRKVPGLRTVLLEELASASTAARSRWRNTRSAT